MIAGCCMFFGRLACRWHLIFFSWYIFRPWGARFSMRTVLIPSGILMRVDSIGHSNFPAEHSCEKPWKATCSSTCSTKYGISAETAKWKSITNILRSQYEMEKLDYLPTEATAQIHISFKYGHRQRAKHAQIPNSDHHRYLIVDLCVVSFVCVCFIVSKCAY